MKNGQNTDSNHQNVEFGEGGPLKTEKGQGSIFPGQLLTFMFKTILRYNFKHKIRASLAG